METEKYDTLMIKIVVQQQLILKTSQENCNLLQEGWSNP